MTKKNRPNRNQGPSYEAEHNYDEEEDIRLNKYIAHCGYCSRRDADDYIAAGKVEVNDEVVTRMGVKVKRSDKVVVEGQTLSLENFEYILLNKPKDTITTTDDPRGRDTVMDKIQDATGKRVYPVGRLDRHTRGLLI
jgi:23S rRNA pseudouridine2605 synthase